jgi:hypothetical protein
MSGTWRIESRVSVHSTWRRQPGFVGMLREDALVAGEWLANRYDLGQFRLQDMSTGELINLGADGKPLPVAVAVVPDRRTEAEVQADRLADRYEASLERGQR